MEVNLHKQFSTKSCIHWDTSTFHQKKSRHYPLNAGSLTYPSSHILYSTPAFSGKISELKSLSFLSRFPCIDPFASARLFSDKFARKLSPRAGHFLAFCPTPKAAWVKWRECHELSLLSKPTTLPFSPLSLVFPFPGGKGPDASDTVKRRSAHARTQTEAPARENYPPCILSSRKLNVGRHPNKTDLYEFNEILFVPHKYTPLCKFFSFGFCREATIQTHGGVCLLVQLGGHMTQIWQVIHTAQG